MGDIERRKAKSGQIHAWLAFESDCDYDRLRDEYRGLLSSDERDRLKRFAFTGDQDRYLLSRALTRTVLARYARSSPDELHFVTDRHGRPALVDTDGVPGLNFSLSRTQGLVLLAVTTANRAIGADVENTACRNAPLQIADEVFSLSERRRLFSLPAGDRSNTFYASWTVKEACAKAAGLGLALDLRRFEVDAALTASVATGVVRSASSAAGRNIRVWAWQPTAMQRAAVCVSQQTGESLDLYYARVMPLRMDGSLQPLPTSEMGIADAATSSRDRTVCRSAITA